MSARTSRGGGGRVVGRVHAGARVLGLHVDSTPAARVRSRVVGRIAPLGAALDRLVPARHGGAALEACAFAIGRGVLRLLGADDAARPGRPPQIRLVRTLPGEDARGR